MLALLGAKVSESVCLWFISLVSKKSTLTVIEGELRLIFGDVSADVLKLILLI